MIRSHIKCYLICTLLLLALVASLLVLSCGKKAPTQEEEEIVISDDVVVLADTTMDKFDHQEGDTMYYFNQNAQEMLNLQTNDIIIATKDDGLLRRVVSVTEQVNFIVVKAEYATLEDVILKGRITLSDVELSPQQMRIEERKKGVTVKSRSAEFIVELDRVLYEEPSNGIEVRAYGRTTFGIKIDTLDIEFNWGLQNFIFAVDVYQAESLGLSVTGNVFSYRDSLLLATFRLPSFSVVVGGIPIWFTPYVNVYIGADLNIQASVNSCVYRSDTLTAGVKYVKGQGWSSFYDYAQDFGYSLPSVSLQADVKGFAIAPDLTLRVYDLVGPGARLEGYGRVHVDPQSTPWWQLYAGLAVYGGVKMEILGWGIAWWATIYSHEWEIANSETVSNNAPNTPSTPSGPSSGYVNVSYPCTSSTTDPDGDDIAIRFDWDDGNISDWSSFVPSGSDITMSHSWGSPGTYHVKAQAKDVNNALSGWSNSHSIVISSGTGWNIQTVDTTGSVGFHNSIALDGSGRPHISYTDWTNIVDLKYAYWTGSSWNIQTVDATGVMGKFNSIALDGSGRPHISYYDGTNYDLKYAYWTGSAWNIQTVDASGYVGKYTSIALDASGRPHISYCDNTNDDLKYAYWTGSSWNIQTVDASGNAVWTSIALDGSDRPHIAYYDETNTNLKYAYWTGSAWNIQTVDATGDVGKSASIALDGSGRSHISYLDGTNYDLKYAYWTGSSWDIQTVDATGDVGAWTSIALDGSGQPHISYEDWTNHNLKYAYWTGSSWNIQTVDANVNGYTSIALDASGRPHISYCDNTNDDLKYAYWTGSW